MGAGGRMGRALTLAALNHADIEIIGGTEPLPGPH